MSEALNSLKEIQEAIISLPDQEKVKLSKWMADIDNQILDNELEQDFQKGGEGADILEKVKSDFHFGKCSKWE
jgi:hypothetical protein